MSFPASHASIYTYLTPVFAVILSLIILHERFSWLFWVGGALISGGIITQISLHQVNILPGTRNNNIYK